MKKINKKAELTTTQIVTIIILVLSFIVILFFYWHFNWKARTDKEICHNSVVMRGSLRVAKESIPLNCKTQQVCLSMGSECENAVAGATTIDVTDKQDILKEITNLMYDCWWQMGAGEIDYESRTSTSTTYCAMCSVIYFDENIKRKYPKIANIEIYNYMKSHNVPNREQSYLQYLYDIDSIEQARTDVFSTINKDIYSISIETNHPYTIITGLSKQGFGAKVISGAVGGAMVIGGIVFLIPSFGTSAVMVAAGTGMVGGGVLTFISTREGVSYIRPMLIPFDADEIINALECKDFSTLY